MATRPAARDAFPTPMNPLGTVAVAVRFAAGAKETMCNSLFVLGLGISDADTRIAPPPAPGLW
nr:hypothetical protein GCM10025732_00340 [Glycomyces mayteni]